LASAGSTITLQLAQDILGTATSQAVLEVIDALVNRQSTPGLEAIHRSLDAGADPRQFARQIIDYLRSLLLVAVGNAAQVDATAEVRAQMARHAQALPISEILRMIQAFNLAATETRSSWQPALPLEIAFIEAISVKEAAVEQKSTLISTPLPAVSTPPSKGKPADQPAAARDMRAESPGSGDVSSEDAVTYQRLDQSWNLVLAQLKSQNSSLSALVNSAKSRALKGNTLTLGMSAEVLRTRLEDPANIEMLQKVLKQVMGKELYVQVVISSATKSTPPSEVDNDGMVASALRDLGGEIVDIQ